MALAKADFVIAREYASLAGDPKDGERIFRIIEEEYRKTRELYLRSPDIKRFSIMSPSFRNRFGCAILTWIPSVSSRWIFSENFDQKQDRRNPKRRCWSRFSSPSTELPQGSEIRDDRPGPFSFFIFFCIIKGVGIPAPRVVVY